MRRVTKIAAVMVCTLPISADAVHVCENLANERVVVAEARYATWDGTDECYGNAYYDGGDELSLGCDRRPGGLTPSDSTRLSAFAIHNDKTGSDGSNVLFTFRIRRVDACTGSCTGSGVVTTSSATLRVNSADPPGSCVGNSCTVHAGKALTITASGSGIFEHWIDVDTSSGCNASDTGCFDIRASGCDQLQNF